jgi:hypothetical protein
MRDLCAVLGKPIHAPVVKALIAEFGERETKTVVDRHYFEFPADGLSLATDEGMNIETVFVYSGDREGFQRYALEMPHGLNLDWDRARVRAALGEPAASGGGEEIPLYGSAARWDRYDFPTHSVHLEYRGAGHGQGIALVTLSTPEATPGRENIG